MCYENQYFDKDSDIFVRGDGRNWKCEIEKLEINYNYHLNHLSFKVFWSRFAKVDNKWTKRN